MPAAIRNFAIDQGATFNQVITWKDSAGAPINLTGYSARMQARKNKNAGDVLVELTTQNGRIILGGSTGRITLNIPASVTAAFNWTRGLYDLELVRADGEVSRLLQGELTVSVGMTR